MHETGLNKVVQIQLEHEIQRELNCIVLLGYMREVGVGVPKSYSTIDIQRFHRANASKHPLASGCSHNESR